MNTLIVASIASREAEFIAGLAVGRDLVIAADGGGAACMAAGIVPDLVVGDMDSLGAAGEAALREAGVRFMTHPAEKDVTDLDLAIDEARRAGTTGLCLTGVLGGRLDHSIASIGSLVREIRMRPHVVEPDLRAWLLGDGGRASLALAGRDALVSLFAIGAAAEVTCRGFRYPLDAETLLPLSSRGLSNVIIGEEAILEVHGGVVLALSVLTNGTLIARERVSSLNEE